MLPSRRVPRASIASNHHDTEEISKNESERKTLSRAENATGVVLGNVAAKEIATSSKLRATSSPGSLPLGLLGQTVGSFRITRVLGDGSVGTVYLGEHPRVGSKVAIKVLHEAFRDSSHVVAR